MDCCDIEIALPRLVRLWTPIGDGQHATVPRMPKFGRPVFERNVFWSGHGKPGDRNANHETVLAIGLLNG